MGDQPEVRFVTGFFVLAELAGPVAHQIRELQQRYDPKLAATNPPHVTVAGSSGVGPILASTPVATIRAALEPIAATTPPLTLRFGAPIRFMQTDIISFPLDAHGPLRTLHERIAASGLPFARPRFQFTPHCTVSYYPTLTRERLRELLALRITDAAVLDRLQVYETLDPLPSRRVLELPLVGREADAEDTSPTR